MWNVVTAAIFNLFFLFICAVQIIAPWRIPEFYNRFRGRKDLMQYAQVSCTVGKKNTFNFIIKSVRWVEVLIYHLDIKVTNISVNMAKGWVLDEN